MNNHSEYSFPSTKTGLALKHFHSTFSWHLKMKLDEITEYLKTPHPITVGLARAGFFGFSSKSDHFKRQAVLDFERYGAQWSPKLPQRLMPEGIDPVVPGWENPPLHTRTEYRVSPSKDDYSKQDTHWLANFFFRPNSFYFPDPEVVKRIYPLRVRLQKKFIADNPSFKVLVYPDPSGRLALIQVYGQYHNNGAFGDCLIEAKNRIIPVLNWLTMQTDHSLPIVQENWVGLPSGDTHFMATRMPKEIYLDPQNFTEHHPLRDAQSLYRVGLNCNEPMYAFLSFCRAYEAIEKVQKEWIKHYRNKLAENETFSTLLRKYGQLRIPDYPVFGEFIGQKLNRAGDTLWNRYRSAIAHSYMYGNEGMLLTGSKEESNQEMQSALATLRYVVKTKIDQLNQMLECALRLSRQSSGSSTTNESTS